MRRLVQLGIPGIISGGITQINIVVGTIIATLQAGRWYRTSTMPTGSISCRLASSALRSASCCCRTSPASLRAGDRAAAMDSQNRSLEFAMLLTLPAAVALAVVPREIRSSACCSSAARSAAHRIPSRRACAGRLRARPAGVRPDQGVLAGAFFAREDTKTPMRYAAVSMIADRSTSRWRSSCSAASASSAARHRGGDHARRRGSMPSCCGGRSARAVIS